MMSQKTVTINRPRAIARAIAWYNKAEHKDIKGLLEKMCEICEQEAVVKI